MKGYRPSRKGRGASGARKTLPASAWIRRLGGPFFRGFGQNRQQAVQAARRQQRQRRVIRCLMATILGGVILSIGAWLGYRGLVASDLFRLTDITVSGNQMIGRQEIIDRAGLYHGFNLLRVDAGQTAARIEKLAWIDRARVRIVWPSRIVLDVTEHRPLALVAVQEEKDGQLFYVDRQGKVFAPVQPGLDIDFPVLTGEVAVSAGEKIGTDTLAAKALGFLRLADQGNPVLPAQAISEIHVAADGLVLYLVDRPFPIYLGRERIRISYYRLVRILERLYRKKKVDQIREIRMDYTESKVLVAILEPKQ